MSKVASKSTRIAKLRDNPKSQVLIIGGGINGLSVFRDLALQDVDVVLVEKNDYCSGASAASSHMIHGGVRYLENGEIRLVKESLQERNRLLAAAPHYVKPLKTTIPIFSVFSGLLSAPIRLFTHSQGKPKERGAILIKVGLILYDVFGRNAGTLPRHRFLGKKKSMQEMPHLNKDVKFTATYYDAAMESPERLALEVLFDGLEAGENARAFNYVSVTSMDQNGVILKDELSGETFSFSAEVIVNTTGPWTDLTNQALGYSTSYMAGTKGSHIVLENKELFEACDNRELFFENQDGRIVLMYPILGKVLVGTTDIPHDMRYLAVCTDEEVEYFFKLVSHVYPNIKLDRNQIVYRYSGVRPLGASGDINPGVISRDYRLVRTSADSEIPVLSLVGGKWTTFRALGEHLSGEVLKLLGLPRKVSTANLPLGGGKGFPTEPEGQLAWVEQHRQGVPTERALQLLLRYGTRATTVLSMIAAKGEKRLSSHPEFTDTEIGYLIEREHVCQVEDIVQRRTNLAFTGEASPNLLKEIEEIRQGFQFWGEGQSEGLVQQKSMKAGGR